MTTIEISSIDRVVKRDLAGWLRVPDHHIEDAVQFAWAQYIQHAARLGDDTEQLQRWIFTVARNEYFRQWHHRCREQPTEELPETGADVDLAEIIDFRDAVAQLHGAPLYGAMYRLLGLSHAQVHQATLFTPRSIERHIRKAYVTLREELAA